MTTFRIGSLNENDLMNVERRAMCAVLMVRTRKRSSTTTSEKYSDFHLSSDTTRKHYGRLNAQNAADTT